MSLEDRLHSLDLPPGKIVTDDDGSPVLWLSDGPVTPELWRRAKDEPGLWPLVLGDDGPWEGGELIGVGADADDFDAAVLLPMWWHENAKDDDEDEITAPFGRDWPGFAPALPPREDPDGAAFRLVESLVGRDESVRLGLVAASRSSDALWLMGWSGPVNSGADMAETTAVLRDWEQRFGARVVGVRGPDVLLLSVAAPPRDHEQALLVAAEHFAFCPDNIWMDLESPTLEAYARKLIGRGSWSFWWD